MRLQQTSTTDDEMTLGAAPVFRAAQALWPDAVAFREAIQNPVAAFADPELRYAQVALDRRGLPVTYSGRFAVVFRLKAANGTNWAVRCFVQADHDGTRRAHYQAVAAKLAGLPGAYFVPFRYVENGIRVGYQWYPVVAMEWAEGETLGRWVDRNVFDAAALVRLCAALGDLLAACEAAGVSHGDWQHDNLLVASDGARVTLVDYDAVSFSGLPPAGEERGHPNFQHPRRSGRNNGAGPDRFSCLVMQTALLALAREPGLWRRFNDDESLLFKATDLADPSRSPVFAAVQRLAQVDPRLAGPLAALETACKTFDLALVPSLPPLEAPASRAATALDPAKWWLGTGDSRRAGATVTAAAAGAATVLDPLDPQQGYLARLFSPESLQAERKYLWRVRALGGMAAVVVFLMLWLLLTQSHFPFYAFWWLFNLGGAGYGKWPRKIVFDELCGEIAKFEKLVEERQTRLAQLQMNGLVPALGTIHDYVQNKLRATPISQVLTAVSGISPSTLRNLRAVGVQTAADLRQQASRAQIPGVSIHEGAALQNWVNQLEMEAAVSFRNSGSFSAQARTVVPQNVVGEIERIEREIGPLNERLAQLQAEKDQFPPATSRAYFRRLIRRAQE